MATNETRWTPGPWVIGTRYADENDVFGADGFSVASVHVEQAKERCPDNVHPARQGPKYRREITAEEWDANAHIIAAAPDLYASLAEIVAEWGYPNTPKWHRALAALAKAAPASPPSAPVCIEDCQVACPDGATCDEASAPGEER